MFELKEDDDEVAGGVKTFFIGGLRCCEFELDCDIATG